MLLRVRGLKSVDICYGIYHKLTKNTLLKRSDIRSYGEGRKCPGNGQEDDQQANGKPNGHGLIFCSVRWSAFDFSRTDGDDGDGHHHHRHMFHTEKAEIPLVHRFFEMMQEIGNDGTEDIQDNPQKQLEMQERYGTQPRKPIPSRIRPMGQPSVIGTQNCEKQTRQYQPTNQRVQE